jgi:Sensors of blue-light using FAD
MNPEIVTDSDEPGFGRSAPLLFNLVYCSRAAPGIDADTVDRIIATSQRNNARSGITGMLVFGEGIFFQWLEGPRDAITRLMGVLRSDPRHGQIVLLSEVEEARERLFPQWDMELVDAEHIRDVLADALEDEHAPHDAAALRALLAEVEARGGAAQSSAN